MEYTGAYFGEGSGPMHYDHVVCSGTEYNLTECVTGTDTRESSHEDDVGVKCNTSTKRNCFCFCMVSFFYIFQLMIAIAMEMFVWWEDHITGRVEWRYLLMEHGGPLDIQV